MIGTSFAEWIFIRLTIPIFRYTPLLYAIGIIALALAPNYSTRHSTAIFILCSLLIAEGIFYIFIWRPYQARLHAKADHPPPLTHEQRRNLFDQCLVNIPCPESYIRWWFLGAELDDICRENLKEFFLWAFFESDSTDTHEDPEHVAQELDEYIAKVEQQLGQEFKPGRGPAKSLRLTIDGIETTYRSLAWYAVIFLVDQATHMLFSWYGFEYYASSAKGSRRTFPPRPQTLLGRKQSPAPDISYWHKPHAPTADESPVVFLHGIGVGLWTYIRFLADIHAAKHRGDGGIGIVAIEILPISFRLTTPPLSKPDFLRQMTTILDHHDWDNFTIVSHSYGSVLTTHMLHHPALNHRVVSIVLIDPVTVMLHLPDVAYNFTRRRPKRANEWQLWYFACTDPGVAHCLGRHFFWRENIVWKEELLARPGDGRTGWGSRRVAVCLAGQDQIADTTMVAQYLAASDHEGSDGSCDNLQVVHFPTLDHAQVFDDPTGRERIVRLVKSHCEASAVDSIQH